MLNSWYNIQDNDNQITWLMMAVLSKWKPC